MPTTSRNAIPYPDNSAPPNGPAAAQGIATAIDSVAIPRFATTAARDAAITAPSRGMLCYVTADQKFYFYRAAWAQVNFPRTILKDTDTSRTNTVAVTADPDFTFAMRANKTYVVELILFVDGSNVNDGKMLFAVPAGATHMVFLLCPALASTDWTSTLMMCVAREPLAVEHQFGVPSALVGFVKFRVVVVNGGTAGAFTAQWAQNVAGAIPTVIKADSYMRWTEVN